MRIIKLHIKNFRGIIDHELNFNGNNAVIAGPNGVGKSAVVDAIDFLLKGEITRLSGEGTGEVSLASHGPHVGCNTAESLVTAKIQSSNGKVFNVTRTIANKDSVQIDDEYKIEFYEMTTYAQNGAHFLSRRELLNFILRSPSKRADQIQSLLNITDLKTIRNAFKKLSKKTKEEFDKLTEAHKEKVQQLNKLIKFHNDEDLL